MEVHLLVGVFINNHVSHPPSLCSFPPPNSLATEPLLLNSSGLPRSNKRRLFIILLRGDRGTDEEIEEHQLIPIIQGRQRDSSVKMWGNPLIWGLRYKLYKRSVVLVGVITAGRDTTGSAWSTRCKYTAWL